MNMILNKQMESRGGHKGFTLVEVIVVLVILAILAAIAIPALTGYIDKAEEKKWIAQARNGMAAMRAVISEGYADGTIGKGLPKSGKYSDYLTAGETSGTAIKYFNPSLLSLYDTETSANPDTGDWSMYSRMAAKLIGETLTTSGTPGFWEVQFYSVDDPSYNLFNAPAFNYEYYPDGNVPGKPVVDVTYGIKGINSDSFNTRAELGNAIWNADIDLNAGYKVYHIKKSK
jgi:prepilin-type N-terminal cleavage/methylation domain-containing protein